MNFWKGGGQEFLIRGGGRGCPCERRKRKALSQSVYIKKVFCRYNGHTFPAVLDTSRCQKSDQACDSWLEIQKHLFNHLFRKRPDSVSAEFVPIIPFSMRFWSDLYLSHGKKTTESVPTASRFNAKETRQWSQCPLAFDKHWHGVTGNPGPTLCCCNCRRMPDASWYRQTSVLDQGLASTRYLVWWCGVWSDPDFIVQFHGSLM